MGISALTQGVNASAFARFSSSTSSLTRASLETTLSTGRQARSRRTDDSGTREADARNALENAQRAVEMARCAC